MNAALRSELWKIRTVRRQVVAAALATCAVPLTSLLVAAAGGLSASDSLTTGAATGTTVGLLAFGSWAAAVTAGEYSLHTLVTSLTSVPRRATLYLAKLGALVATSGVGAIVSGVISLLLVWAVVPRGTPRLGHPAALLGLLPAVLAITVIGAAAGVLTRSPSAAIAAVVAAVLLPQTAGGLLGSLQPWVVGASPGTVVTQIVGSTQLTPQDSFPAGAAAAAVTLLVVAAALAGCGALAFHRRDG